MPLSEAITLAADRLGGQVQLAEALGIAKQHVTNMKMGRRACGRDQRIAIYEYAGLDPKLAIIEHMCESLDDNDETERAVKASLMAIVKAYAGKALDAQKILIQRAL